MIGFTGREILLSALYAGIFGFGYSFIYQLALITSRIFKSLPSIAEEIFDSDKLLPSPTVKKYIKAEKEGIAFAFLSVFFFFVDFLMLSYLSLDGQIRLYMLILSSASFYFSNSAFFVVLRWISSLLINSVLFILSIAVRMTVLPIRRLLKSRKFNKTGIK